MSVEAAKHYISAFTAYEHFCSYVRRDRNHSRARKVASYFRRQQKNGRTRIDRYVAVSEAIFRHHDDHEKSRLRMRTRFESLEGIVRMPGITTVQFTEEQMRHLYAMMQDDEAIETDARLARRIGTVRSLTDGSLR